MIFRKRTPTCRGTIRAHPGYYAILHTCAQAICQAAYSGDVHQVHQLVKTDIKNLNVQDETFGDTPIIAACRRGNVRTVKYLLDQKADVSIRNKKKRTCLHYVAKKTFTFYDYLMIIILMPILLIGYLIMKTIQKKHVNLMKLLLSSKVEIDAVDYKGNTALHYACLNKSHGLIPLLVERNADTSIRNNDPTAELVL
ncbi:ankyrin repeat domain-containing protein 22 isoform X2 [Electrophorus electricus]|uniref:ankyrin repeat domain-containing protein 22 isoform X2 n=1 Tax=Electrophorus electricus TaxID=8005 RepID=UPI0015D03F09|nr:ankyrin repeat domain-containing protein 22 isoform X2 [Electrophorus electricus]